MPHDPHPVDVGGVRLGTAHVRTGVHVDVDVDVDVDATVAIPWFNNIWFSDMTTRVTLTSTRPATTDSTTATAATDLSNMPNNNNSNNNVSTSLATLTTCASPNNNNNSNSNNSNNNINNNNNNNSNPPRRTRSRSPPPPQGSVPPMPVSTSSRHTISTLSAVDQMSLISILSSSVSDLFLDLNPSGANNDLDDVDFDADVEGHKTLSSSPPQHHNTHNRSAPLIRRLRHTYASHQVAAAAAHMRVDPAVDLMANPNIDLEPQPQGIIAMRRVASTPCYPL